MSKGYDKPNYTQVPNVFLEEHILEMGEAEYKIVACVIRYTFGYHRERFTMSLSFFEEHTGLTHQGVIDGLKAAMQRGVIQRSAAGNSYEYWLVVNEIDYPDPGESTKLTRGSQANRPDLVKQVDSFEHPLKKEKENSKESGDLPDLPEEVTRVWETALGELQLSMPREAFDTIVSGAQVVSYEDGLFTIQAQSPYAREWLEHRLKKVVLRTLTSVAQCNVDVKFVAEGSV